MKYWPLLVHVEIEFDSASIEPLPWWRPFLWLRIPTGRFSACYGIEWTKHDAKENGVILRCGALGLHFCIALHWYGD